MEVIAMDGVGVAVACEVLKAIRAADAKEVGVGNPAEETYRYPNQACRNPRDYSQDVNI
jgi:hypothetical protein